MSPFLVRFKESSEVSRFVSVTQSGLMPRERSSLRSCGALAGVLCSAALRLVFLGEGGLRRLCKRAELATFEGGASSLPLVGTAGLCEVGAVWKTGGGLGLPLYCFKALGFLRAGVLACELR